MTRTPASLTSRLLVISLAWLLPALMIGGWLLMGYFELHLQQRFDAGLNDHLEELVAVAEINSAITLAWQPTDPRFNRPLSGWYWQIVHNGKTVHRSPSLADGALTLPSPLPEGVTARMAGSQKLRLLARAIRFPERAEPVIFAIAGPEQEITHALGQFTWFLTLTLTGLGLVLAGAVVAQVRIGLRPLIHLRHELATIRQGERERLSEGFPLEVRPLVKEMNALLDYNSALAERGRHQSGNLAHALKNPLAVLRNQVDPLPDPWRQPLQRLVAELAATVERQLAEARVAGVGNPLAADTPVLPVVDDLIFSLERLYRERGLRFHVSGLEGVRFRGDGEDLEELLGCLMDNACKWGRTEVTVSGGHEGDRIVLTIEDDGPGIPEEARERALGRGQRLDEAPPGSGLGLHIAGNLVRLYHGEMRLEEGGRGGLRVVLRLPGA